jgi:hypothetical protein
LKRHADVIDSKANADQPSDTVVARLRPGLELLGFRVEKAKKAEDTRLARERAAGVIGIPKKPEL